MEKQFADINHNALISANQGRTYLHLVSIVPYIDMLKGSQYSESRQE